MIRMVKMIIMIDYSMPKSKRSFLFKYYQYPHLQLLGKNETFCHITLNLFMFIQYIVHIVIAQLSVFWAIYALSKDLQIPKSIS